MNIYKVGMFVETIIILLTVFIVIFSLIDTQAAEEVEESTETEPVMTITQNMISQEKLNKDADLIAGAEDPIYIESEDEVVEDIEYDFNNSGYITATKLNVRSGPSTEDQIMKHLYWNEKVNYSFYPNDITWSVIKIGDDKLGYIKTFYIQDDPATYKVKEVEGDTRKSYMDFRKITTPESQQKKLQENSTTDDQGRRMINGRYLIAMGKGLSNEIGRYCDVVLENGTVIPCIIGDAKADKDTIANNTRGADGGAVEFIIDSNKINSSVKTSGDMSNLKSSWNSKVIEVDLYDMRISY